MMAYFEELKKMKNEEEFVAWFWQRKGAITNGGQLIRSVNAGAFGTNRVRHEVYGPMIYAVKMNGLGIAVDPNESTGTKTGILMKVGYSHTNTSQTHDASRINTLMKDIKRDMKKKWGVEVKCAPAFVLSIDVLDTRYFSKIESEVRSRAGMVVPINVAKALQLPVHTEWVLTTNFFIAQIRKRIRELQGTQPSQRQSTRGGPNQYLPPSQGACSAGELESEEAGEMEDDMTERKDDAYLEGGTIDTGTVFGQGGVKFGAVKAVAATFDVVKAYKDNEVNVSFYRDQRLFVLAKSKK